MKSKFVCLVLLFCAVSIVFSADITLTIIYDNTCFDDRLVSDWGFACLIECPDKTILFDTGTLPEVLFKNANMLNIDFKQVDDVLISHNHRDHIGGLDSVLSINNNVRVWIPGAFPALFAQNVSSKGAEHVIISESVPITEHVWSTGQLGDQINEQSLFITTDKGLVIITGCAHPGILHIVETVKHLNTDPIYLVFGGFHLLDKNDNGLDRIVKSLKDFGVDYCGATHCTGKHAIEYIANRYGDHFIPMGAGKVMQFTIN